MKGVLPRRRKERVHIQWARESTEGLQLETMVCGGPEMQRTRGPENERCERHMEVRGVPGEQAAQCLHVMRRESAR